MKQKFVIYAYSFNINSGGVIVLFQLCHLLNLQGYQASIWMHKNPIFNYKKPFSSLYYKYKFIIRKKFKTHSVFNTPIATTKDLKDAIVIYPEIVDGNPLNADKVVRWLLHKPGFHSGKINYGVNDLILGYGKECSGSNLVITDEKVLITKYIMTDIYKQTNFKDRKGSCHMIRKGIGKPFIHDSDSILVDSMSHLELSKVFNQMEFFISYDPYTYYTTYAALCGCKSIVIPDTGINKEEWHPNIKDTYGIAYGVDDIDFISKSKHLLIEHIHEQENDNINAVNNMITQCQIHFGNN